MLREEMKSFCSETSIHGLGQIANDRASIIKRLLWLAIFVGCLTFAGKELVLSIQGKSDHYSPVHLVLDLKRLHLIFSL